MHTADIMETTSCMDEHMHAWANDKKIMPPAMATGGRGIKQFKYCNKLQQQTCSMKCTRDARTSWTAGGKLRVEVEGIINVTHDRLEWRHHEAPVQAVPADRCKEQMTFYVTHSTRSNTCIKKQIIKTSALVT